MEIRRAEKEEFEAVRAFYYDATDAMQETEYKPGWQKDIYPEMAFLSASVERGELFVGEEGGKVVAAMVLNRDSNDGYAKVQWPTEAAPGEVLLIHALCVHASCAGRGLGKELVRYAIDEARRQGMKAMRLDVLKGNVPAERLYPACGFHYVDTVVMFYEDTGWTDYELYELAL